MSKIMLAAGLFLAGLLAPAAHASVIGPDASVCTSGSGSAILVRVEGLKDRTGPVRVRTFGGDPANYFNKKKALKRIELPAPASGPIEICMAVPGPGTYAVDVRHDVNRDGKTNKADGAGASGNPDISFFDVVFGRKPSATKVAVVVGNGTVPINITVKYLQGGSFKPFQAAQR